MTHALSDFVILTTAIVSVVANVVQVWFWWTTHRGWGRTLDQLDAARTETRGALAAVDRAHEGWEEAIAGWQESETNHRATIAAWKAERAARQAGGAR